MNKITSSVFALIGLGVACQSATASAEGWQFEATPYLLASGMEGKAGVRGVTGDVDVSFSDILDTLDMGFMGLFTAKKGPWLFGLEGVYMKLSDSIHGSVTGPGGLVSIDGKLDMESTMSILQGTVGYRVLDGKTKVYVLGALRYTNLDADVKVKVSFDPPIYDGKTRASGDKGWTDLVAGVSVNHQLTDNVALVGYADVGGSNDDTTYQFIAGADWEFKKDYLARFGYRYLSWDYENGGTKWDVAASGPYIGLGIKF